MLTGNTRETAQTSTSIRLWFVSSNITNQSQDHSILRFINRSSTESKTNRYIGLERRSLCLAFQPSIKRCGFVQPTINFLSAYSKPRHEPRRWGSRGRGGLIGETHWRSIIGKRQVINNLAVRFEVMFPVCKSPVS